MRMLDGGSEQTIHQLQLYLLPNEAMELISAVTALLRDTESNEHKHVFGNDGLREISISIMTSKKMELLDSYSKAEQLMFKEK